jgi:hypothetical protein
MTILMWNKPEKIMSVEDWQAISADNVPLGVYQPNMSEDDKERWKAKLVGHKVGRPHVEIRKSAKGTQIFLLVSLGGGYKYRGCCPDSKWNSTIGTNLHFALNGSARLTFKDWEDMQQAVDEAKAVLEKLKNQQLYKAIIEGVSGGSLQDRLAALHDLWRSTDLKERLVRKLGGAYTVAEIATAAQDLIERD